MSLAHKSCGIQNINIKRNQTEARWYIRNQQWFYETNTVINLLELVKRKTKQITEIPQTEIC